MTSISARLAELPPIDMPLLAKEYAIHALRARLALARELLQELLKTDWAEECQECGIGQVAAWKPAKAFLAKLDSEL